MDFDRFIREARRDHADAPAAVAARLARGRDLVRTESDLVALMRLAHHVHGEHLGDWPGALRFFAEVPSWPQFDAAGPSGRACRRHVASLRLCAGVSDALDGLPVSDRVQAGAAAAASLGLADAPRARALLDAAVATAEAAGLPPDDPLHRALAVDTHNMACSLEELLQRDAVQRDLMLLAAKVSRRHWEIAGTWLEVERAEYRLSSAWLCAGDTGNARRHAQACLDIVRARGAPAVERLFAWEALGRVERADGNTAAHARALDEARQALAQLEPDDRAACAASVEALAA